MVWAAREAGGSRGKKARRREKKIAAGEAKLGPWTTGTRAIGALIRNSSRSDNPTIQFPLPGPEMGKATLVVNSLQATQFWNFPLPFQIKIDYFPPATLYRVFFLSLTFPIRPSTGTHHVAFLKEFQRKREQLDYGPTGSPECQHLKYTPGIFSFCRYLQSI